MAYASMFEIWRSTVGEFIFEIALDLGHAEDYPLSTHPWFFCVRIPMADKTNEGLPPEAEAERLDKVENRVREVAKQRDGIYVGRRQGQGNRDLLFYFTRRPSGLDDRMRASMGMELLFISRDDAGWKGYEQLLPGPRDWRYIADTRLINDLINLNADPKLEHECVHRVSTTLQKGAEALVELMRKLELEDVQIIGTKPNLLVTGIQKTVLNADELGRVSFVLESKAEKARGEYLGWVAEPQGTGEAGLFDDLDDIEVDDDFDFDDDVNFDD